MLLFFFLLYPHTKLCILKIVFIFYFLLSFVYTKQKNKHRNVIFIVCSLECSVLLITVITHIWNYKYFYAFVNTVHIVLGLVGA